MTGIEPASQPWEGRILPMNYICGYFYFTLFSEKIKAFIYWGEDLGSHKSGTYMVQM